MLQKVWPYRFLLYNLLMALYFQLLSPWVSDLVIRSFYEEERLPILSWIIGFALLAETVGILLKIPAFRQRFNGQGLNATIGPLLNRYVHGLFNFILFFAFSGRLVLGVFLLIFASKAYGVELSEAGGFWGLLIGVEVVRALLLVAFLTLIGPKLKRKKEVDLKKPPSSFIWRDLMGDLFLLIFSGLVFSILWMSMMNNPNLKPVDMQNASAIASEAIAGVFVFFMLYIPPNLPHFILHTAHLDKENRREQWLYWGTWLVVLIVALAPRF